MNELDTHLALKDGGARHVVFLETLAKVQKRLHRGGRLSLSELGREINHGLRPYEGSVAVIGPLPELVQHGCQQCCAKGVPGARCPQEW
jgi:hypothetical protein